MQHTPSPIETNEIQILTSNHLSGDARKNVSAHLSEVSNREPAMLGRPPEFYEKSLEEHRLVIAIKGTVTNIVGSGSLLPLGDGLAEISGVFVEQTHRGQGIGKEIIHGVQRLAKEHSLSLLLTMKPNTHGSEGMIIEAVENGFVPTPYNVLKQNFPEAFRECCVCQDENGSENCQYRDSNCVLGMDVNIPSVQKSTIEFIHSPTFQKAIPTQEMHKRITSLVLNLISPSVGK